MRSLPIFFAWVRTWRYRLSRAATPTVNRSATIAPCVAVCNTAGIVPAGFAPCVGPSGALTLCVQFPRKRGRVDVVDELALDLVRLPHLGERCPRPLAEVAVVRVVDDDPRDRDPASSSPRRRARRRG